MIVGAVWVVGFVEVENVQAVFLNPAIHVSSADIGAFAVGQIIKGKKKIIGIFVGGEHFHPLISGQRK